MLNIQSTQPVIDDVPREVRMLAEALSRLHGPSIIRKEKNGYHIYLPSPACLATDGRRELQSKHLTVNASKYKELPEWVNTHKGLKHDPDFSAVCHKTSTRYRVSDLLDEKKFPTLDKRGIPNVASHVASFSSINKDSLVSDGRGNMVPRDPGDVVPIIDLPNNHPAVEYLLNRNYDLDVLYRQMRCSYCTREAPEDPTCGIFYKRMPLRFKDTPQGRIILYAFIDGVQVGWQSRIIERVAHNVKEYWHPYANMWVPVETLTADNKWVPMDGVESEYNGFKCTWKPSKYKTAFGMSRNNALIGVDAAVQFNKLLKLKKRIAVLAEGPLDAGRFGPMGIAMLGKYLSQEQAQILINRFDKIIMVMDNDKAGEEARRRITQVMQDKLTEVVFADVPEGIKDAGAMTTAAAMELIYPHLR